MKIDFIGQVVLITSALLMLYFKSGMVWTNALLIFLALWQILSAIHLLLIYQYVKRVNFLKAMLVVLISLPVWINLVGIYAYVPVGGILIWYFIQTILETRIVYRRPRSFWDL